LPNLEAPLRAVLSVATLLLAVPASAQKAAPAEVLRTDHEAGRPGGRLVYAVRSEPKTLNPVTAVDVVSREVVGRLQADLIHIDRQTQRAGSALAKSWTVSPDGLHYTLLLRRGLRFSDGHPFDADDVLFTFRCYLDERNASPQRDLLVIGGKPVGLRKLDAFRVAFDLAQPYAAAERLFDSLAILPRHLLEKAQDEGRLGGAWGLSTPPSEIAGLGAFRLKSYVPGERIVLERNPYYWKVDSAGRPLPYLDELVFLLVPSDDAQVVRFKAGETDVISRLSAPNFDVPLRRGLRGPPPRGPRRRPRLHVPLLQPQRRGRGEAAGGGAQAGLVQADSVPPGRLRRRRPRGDGEARLPGARDPARRPTSLPATGCG
jgi:peptide/nickel transport system substrate-binding protein